MKRNLTYSEDARKKVFVGVEKVAKAVATTLGPAGLNVLIERKDMPPVITKDGVTAARSIELEDPEENLGASLIKEVASKTNDVAGDNTTTSTVLGYAIAKEGIKAVSAGFKPMEIKRGIDAATKDVIESLKKISKPVSNNKDITNVATISANNDAEIGTILADAISKIGKDGIITVEESKNIETSVKVVEGMQFDNGYLSPYFSTNRERLETEFDNSFVMITDNKISAISDILPLVEHAAKLGKPITIICDDMEGEALGTLVMNSVRGSLKSCVVKAPGFGDDKKHTLEDMAILTGATFISNDFGITMDKVTTDMLGTAKVKVTKSSTTITNGGGDKTKLSERIEEIKKQIENTSVEYDKSKLKKRLAKLSSGVAVVSVGAATETELKEKKFRIEDTIAATKAALEEGIIPGGGVALVNAAANVKPSKTENTDFDRGYEILLKSVDAPLKQIAENAGVNGEVVLNNINGQPGYGYDAKNGKYVDMISNGIVDTTKAIRLALANAASIAGLILTTECTITDIREEKPQLEIAQQPLMM